MIQAGKLKKRVILQKPQKIDNGYGGRVVTYADECTVWAEFLKPRFSNGNIRGAAAEMLTQGIRIRACEIGRGWRIIYNSHVYDVLHVDESEIAAGALILTTEEVQP